jgi:phosphatidyl-myo-inositol dimannoside synthase
MAVPSLSSVHAEKLTATVMEILVVTWNYPPRQGGMEQLLAKLCAGLSHRHCVSVITAYAEKNVTAGSEVVFRPAAPGLVRYFLFAVTKGFTLLRGNHRIRVVLGGSVLVAPIVVFLSGLFRRKGIILAHGLDLIYQNWLYQCGFVQCLRFADRVIANSWHTAKLVVQKGVDDSAIEVIPPGVDGQRFQSAENPDALKQRFGLVNRKIILFVGRLARRKGVKEFIDRCLIHIIRQSPEVCFLIAGDNPMESLAHHHDVASEIRQTIANQNLCDHVRWLGAVSDTELVQLYGLCDVLVLPLLDLDKDVEGFGMVALEASAMGKPVVAFGCGGIVDAVEDGKSGILVEPGNYQAMSAVIVTLLNDPDMATSIGRCGQKRVIRDFTWNRIVVRYETVFNRADEKILKTPSQSLI